MEFPDYIKARKRTSDKALTRYYDIDESLAGSVENKKYFLRTYGCQMNEHDSEHMIALIEAMGFVSTDNYEEADLAILNTCSIRENAHNKAFGMLGRFKHLKETDKPDLIVGLGGCMSQEEGVARKIFDKYKWLNFVFGTHNIDALPRLINKSFTSDELQIEVESFEGDIVEGMPVKRDSKLKAFVNIIYGCDKFCTYCIVPFTRGAQRSRKPEDIIDEVKDLVSKGYQEVTLLGQNVNAYGKDLDINYTMENLLEDVAKTGIPRLKFMTSHPWDFTDRMIEVIASYDNIAPFIHLPVQSGSSKVLKLMGRRYTRESYLELVKKIKDKIPGVSLSTDIIVAFPGETDEDFAETISLCHECKFDNAFTFIFSERENTAAAQLPDKVDKITAQKRLAELNKVVNSYFLESNKARVGKVEKVLIEGKSKKEGYYHGYSATNKLVNVLSSEDITGKIVEVEIDKAKTWSLDGKRR